MHCGWPEEPINHPLSDDEIHIWCADLIEAKKALSYYQSILSADELERTEQYRFEKDRTYFILRRGILRKLLGGYLDVQPAELIFNTTQYGKPFLVSPKGKLQFNLSHSQSLALMGFGLYVDIGVDLEYIRSDFEFEDIAYRYFSTHEQDSLRFIPAEHKAWAFFACWTRKEAYIKARGEGLSLPLDSFDVSLLPGEEARLISTRPNAIEIRDWKLLHLDPALGFLGAIAWSSHKRLEQVNIHRWGFNPLT